IVHYRVLDVVAEHGAADVVRVLLRRVLGRVDAEDYKRVFVLFFEFPQLRK
ncbi:MAG: hypothetical protein HOL45_09910, partial [Chloroflexi bacterium]|nr:hypothetical protein [Chloroflexota bacterium]